MVQDPLLEVSIPQYIKHVKLSNKRRPKYYKLGDKIPKKYSTYKYKKFKTGKQKKTELFLIDPEGNRVVSNPRAAGTPSWKKINGQDIYNQNLHFRVRSKIIKEMKSFFNAHFKNEVPLSVDDLPVYPQMEVHDVIGNGDWDSDNHFWVYNKVIQDVAVFNKVIPDDSIRYITRTPEILYFPVEKEEDRKMVYRLYQEDRPEILKHPFYAEVHRESHAREDFAL